MYCAAAAAHHRSRDIAGGEATWSHESRCHGREARLAATSEPGTGRGDPRIEQGPAGAGPCAQAGRKTNYWRLRWSSLVPPALPELGF